jgi:DNA-binding NtrC family response regulator
MNARRQPMAREIDLLIVSSRLENKKTILRFLEGLPLNIYTVGNVEESEETLEEHEIDVVVCDERLSDGAYHDVLALTIDRKPKIHFIVLLCTGGQEEYCEAIRLGATDVVRPPLHATDIELALIHALRQKQAVLYAVTGRV